MAFEAACASHCITHAHGSDIVFLPAATQLSRLRRKGDLAGKSVNKVTLLGNLGKDPEVKFTPQGTAVAELTLATNERYKDKEGQWQDRTEWHNVVLWQRLAEIAGEYLKKGSKVYIEGRLQTRSWEDKQTNQKKYMTEVVATDLVLLGGRGDSGGTLPAAQPRARTINATPKNPRRVQPDQRRRYSVSADGGLSQAAQNRVGLFLPVPVLIDYCNSCMDGIRPHSV